MAEWPLWGGELHNGSGLLQVFTSPSHLSDAPLGMGNRPQIQGIAH